MGLFDKIKNILFEDDEEENSEIPMFSKDDKDDKEDYKEEKKKEEKDDFIPIQTDDTSRFRNVKRDFDFSFDESEVLNDIKEPVEVKEEVKEEVVVTKIEEPVVERQPEKKDVFLSFDEDEFERLNSRGPVKEEKIKREFRRDYTKEVKKVEDPMAIARRANNNFSSTTPTINTKDVLRTDADRYKITTSKDVKKPFTPSPVISPVYGILDKNYTKDSIVDKKDGMKRERLKPIKTEVVLSSELEKQAEKKKEKEEQPKKTVVKEDKKVNIDLVRKKAYGLLEEEVKPEEDVLVNKKSIVLTTVGEQEDFVDFQEKFGDDIVDEAMMAVANYNTNKEEINIEDKVEEDLNKSKVQEYDNSVKEVKIVSEDDSRNKILDDLEKTSTLQILDDIEKELSSIKPISKSYNVDSDERYDSNDDTLENDLFNLIDSMYEQGEEDEYE